MTRVRAQPHSWDNARHIFDLVSYAMRVRALSQYKDDGKNVIKCNVDMMLEM